MWLGNRCRNEGRLVDKLFDAEGHRRDLLPPPGNVYLVERSSEEITVLKNVMTFPFFSEGTGFDSTSSLWVFEVSKVATQSRRITALTDGLGHKAPVQRWLREFMGV